MPPMPYDALRCPAMPCGAPVALRSPDFELIMAGGTSKHAKLSSKRSAKDDRNLLIAVRGQLLESPFLLNHPVDG